MTPTSATEGNAVQFEQHIVEAKQHYEEAHSRLKSVQASANDALAEALLCGQALVKARELTTHGQWAKLLKLHWPEMSHDTASRWMKLSNYAHVQDLSGCNSLRQAYLAAGIIHEEAPTTESAEPKTVILNVSQIERLSHRIELQRAEVLGWDKERREKLKAALKPIVDVYEQIKEQDEAIDA